MHRKAGQSVMNKRHRAVTNNSNTSDSSDSSDSQQESPESSDSQQEPDIPAPDPLQITRRKNLVGHLVTQKKRHAAARDGKRDIASLQAMWYNHAREASKLYTPSMWRVLFAVKNESKTTQSAVLSACRRMLPARQRPLWPISRQQVDKKIAKSLGSFHCRTLRQVQIDLTRHGLPDLAKPITFSFMDPVYGWACCAHRVSAFHKLHFEYIAHLHPSTGERLYGASVAHGDVMRRACHQVPTEPALIGISYDAGQASKRRSYVPIVLSVANTDSRCSDACTCLGYMPVFDLQAYSLPVRKAVMHDLRQACIGAIIDVIEASAQDGFECILWEQTHRGPVQVRRLLFPIVCRMEFDTKGYILLHIVHIIHPHHILTTYTHNIERYKFFCCSKQHACGIGSGPRQGHSALRPCTPHGSRTDLAAKRAAAADPNSTNFKEACESLTRRGIDPLRVCTALAGRNGCLLDWPGRIHFGLFGYDVLHILYSGAVGYLLEGLLATMTPSMKGVLDTRALKLGSFRKDSGYILFFVHIHTTYTHIICPHHTPTSYAHIICPQHVHRVVHRLPQ